MDNAKVVDAQIELLRRRAWSDFYVFAKFVAGKTLMEEKPHRELCEFMMKGLDQSTILGIDSVPEPTTDFVKHICQGTLRKLMQLPRNSFKSSVTQAFVAWLLWHNPNLRIMLDSETLANSKLYLAGIKDLIANNEMMKKICVNSKGGYALEPNRKVTGGFVEDQIILKDRTAVGLKEPSVFCSGVDNARTGMHPDVIIMDDLVSERNVSTDVQLQKCEDHYKYSLSLLEIGGGLLFVIGTRYHMADLYGHLIGTKSLDCLVRPAISEDGELYFPTRLTREFLADMRKDQGSYIYSCQYMLDPINPDDAMFSREHVHYIDELDYTPSITRRYITIDPAISLKEKADFSVIMVMGTDDDNKRYIERVIRAKLTPYVLIDKIFEVAAETKALKKIGIETVAFQKMLMYAIKDEMRRRNKYLPIQELRADTDKIRRAGKIQPVWENDDIYLDRYECRDLVRELTEFPFSEHDDTVDALAYMEQLMFPRKMSHSAREYEYTPANSITNY